MFDKLMEKAKFLKERFDTDWAYEHEDEYAAFRDTLDAEYASGTITDRQHDRLALIALADDSWEPKCADNVDIFEEV